MNFKGEYIVDCRDKHGNWKWSERMHNIVTTTGIQHIMRAGLASNATTINVWYVGLMDSLASQATNADAMDSIVGSWTECTEYSEDTRPIWEKSVSGVNVGNTGAKATFTLQVDGTVIGGAFLCSSKTGGGDSGILLSAAAFAAEKTGDSGDKLEVSYKIVGSDDTSS